ncbi:GTP pyrophosphokinase, partial [Streptomyces sp. NPDC058308]
MPDESQPLTAAKAAQRAKQASAGSAAPVQKAEGGQGGTSAQRAQAEVSRGDKPAEQPRPKPPADHHPTAPAIRPATGQPGRSGSSNRVRARLARLGVQRSNPYNPVLEPLLRIVRTKDTTK